MGRNFGLKPKDTARGMRCDWQYKRDCGARVKAALVVAITLVALVAVYALVNVIDAKAVEVVKLDHTEKLLASYMTHGAVESEDTIFTCAAKAYEMPKGI